METPKIKGAGFLEILKWYASVHGPGRLRRVSDRMPSIYRHFITRPDEATLGLLPGTWYPSEFVSMFFKEMTVDLSPVLTRQMAQEAVKVSVGNTLNGLYAGIFRLLVSPKMLANNYQRLWRLYHNTGEFVVHIESQTRYEFRLSKWDGHDDFICLMNFFATRLILEMLGMKDVTGQQAACVSKGAAHCSYIQSWKG